LASGGMDATVSIANKYLANQNASPPSNAKPTGSVIP